MADAPFQSLYRRYRPRTFAEVRGQEHVMRALRNAVRDSRVAHAYLFSGPRGTGKTSTARILAKALNCTDLRDGEPCGRCASCVAVQQGSSLDVHELDAASNNGVEAMRDLISRAALGTPGRWKVYIVDEVHMLSNAASNTLLKTLEEPPAHVVFVLATTDPQKVLPTVRSRTQHYEFRLLAPDVLAGLLRDVSADADLGVQPEVLDLVVRRGRGSARDALSALDQVAAAGEVEEEAPVDDAVVEALCERDPGRVLVAVAEGCRQGRDPRRMAEQLIERLRDVFLVAMNATALVDAPDAERERLADQARRLTNPGITRALDLVGQAIAEMREALDPRIALEVALVRAANPDVDPSPAALLERVVRLERALSGHVAEPARAAAHEAAAAPATRERDTTAPAARPGGARASLGALRPSRPGPPAAPGPVPAPPPAPVRQQADAAPPPPAPAGLPSRDALTKAWGDAVLRSLPQRARVRFSAGRFSAVADGTAVFALPNSIHRDRCEEVRAEVEAALARHFGRPVPLRLVVDDVPPPDPGGEPDDDPFDPSGLQEAPPGLTSPEDVLKRAFPGAQEVEQ